MFFKDYSNKVYKGKQTGPFLDLNGNLQDQDKGDAFLEHVLLKIVDEIYDRRSP